MSSQLQLPGAQVESVQDSPQDRWAQFHLDVLRNVAIGGVDCRDLCEGLLGAPVVGARSIGDVNQKLCGMQEQYEKLQRGGQKESLTRMLTEVQAILQAARQQQSDRLAGEVEQELLQLENEYSPATAESYRCFAEWLRCKGLDGDELKADALGVLADGGPELSYRQLEVISRYAFERSRKLSEQVSDLERRGLSYRDSESDASHAARVCRGLMDVMEYRRCQEFRVAEPQAAHS